MGRLHVVPLPKNPGCDWEGGQPNIVTMMYRIVLPKTEKCYHISESMSRSIDCAQDLTCQTHIHLGTSELTSDVSRELMRGHDCEHTCIHCIPSSTLYHIAMEHRKWWDIPLLGWFTGVFVSKFLEI